MTAAATSTGSSYKWFVLGMLWFVYVLNFLDRQLLSILAKPIQDTLKITDGDLGKIGGLYFALFYCLIAIPVGWLADRVNRVHILSAACGLWSAATIGCGLAANYFPQLVIARMTVGVGEAGGVPPSYAIVSDYFPSGRRGTALGIYNLGPPVGQALGVAFGASIAAALNWRYAFIILGAVGVVTALMVLLTVREPKRGGLDQATHAPAPPRASFMSTAAGFFSNPTLVLIAIGGGLTQFVTYGVGNFTVLFLQREKGMTLEEVAIWYALVVAIAMSGGIFFSGRMIDRYTRRSKVAYAFLPAISLLFAVPFYLGFVGAADWKIALLFLIGPTFLNYFYLSSSVTLVQQEVAPNRRVMSGALLLLIMNLTGLGLGPTFVGGLSDYLKPTNPEHSLQIALYALTPVYGLAIICFLILAARLRKSDRISAAAA